MESNIIRDMTCTYINRQYMSVYWMDKSSPLRYLFSNNNGITSITIGDDRYIIDNPDDAVSIINILRVLNLYYNIHLSCVKRIKTECHRMLYGTRESKEKLVIYNSSDVDCSIHSFLIPADSQEFDIHNYRDIMHIISIGNNDLVVSNTYDMNQDIDNVYNDNNIYIDDEYKSVLTSNINNMIDRYGIVYIQGLGNYLVETDRCSSFQISQRVIICSLL